MIELDHKKVAKYRRNALWVIGIYLIILPIHIPGIVLNNPTEFNWWAHAFTFTIYTTTIGAYLYVIRRGRRFRRTEHHLFVDETGLTMVDGHARVDIPWGDIEEIKMNGKYILIKVRPNTPYKQRKYRLYDEYTLPLTELHEQIDALWIVGRNKGKLLE